MVYNNRVLSIVSILILIALLIINSFLREIQNRRTLFSQEEIVLTVALPIISPTCEIETRYFTFTITSCRDLLSTQAVTVIGSLSNDSDEDIFKRKRLIISDIKPYELRMSSLNDWKLAFNYELLTFKEFIFGLLREYSTPYQGGLVIALVFGNTEWLIESVEPYFKNTGTLHILAASGQNVSLVLLMVEPLIPVTVSSKGKGILLLCVCALYLLVVGFQPSLTRASAMAGYMIISRYMLYCQYNALYSLVVSVPLLLIWRPEWIVSIGFWLSVSATLGIILLFRLFQDKVEGIFLFVGSFFSSNVPKMTNTMSSYIIESSAAGIAAQVATFPILFTQFGTVQLLSFIPTMIVGWLIPVIITYTVVTTCIVSLITHIPFLHRLGSMVAISLVWLPSDFFLHILKLLSEVTWWEVSNPWYVSSF